MDDPDRKLPGLAKRLEDAFVAERETWWNLGRALSADPGGDFAHMPTTGAFGSDFGVMLAWARLVGDLAQSGDVTLVICNDPWLFRHLMGIDGVWSGKPPSLIPETARRRLRGFFARVLVSWRNMVAAIRLSPGPRMKKNGATALMVYAHPASDAKGNDAYFGDLMARHEALIRLLHTDCPAEQALELGADGRTASLHAWGNPLYALLLVFRRWRPGSRHLISKFGWLILRASNIENSGGGPAMNRWQAHCQKRWLRATRPNRVLWPWENHGWERNLCRAARNQKVTTIGYQHTVIGPHQFNYAIHTNHDGLESVPDVIVADGPAYLDEMQAWGMPLSRLVIGGAFRFPRFADDLYDPQGPVFVPLSAIAEAARAQLDVARTVADKGRCVLVKAHPMYPLAFDESENLVHAELPLAQQRGLSAVLYTTGASGLEAALMGIPGYRLMLEDRIAIDVLPREFTTHAVTAGEAAQTILESREERSSAAWDEILCDPDRTLWKSLLFGDIDAVMKPHPDSPQSQ